MTWLSDSSIARLREVTEQPDLEGTRYTLVRELGRGGMGVVYEAHDAELDRAVAMKIVATDAPAAVADRLAREARIVARLEHPGIVPVHDVGVLPDGRVFYTMKLVRGRRLDEWIRANHPRADVLRMFVRICEAVAFAHASGVVHRDLKPENVMVGAFGAVLVMDWGVAQAVDDGSDRAIVGTPGFMSPEQSRGEPADPRSDVYALGILLRGLVTDKDRRLSAIGEKATSQNREDRYPTARELGDDILHFLDGQRVSAYRENVLQRAGREVVRHRALVVLIGAYIVMRAIVFFWIRM